PSDWRLQFTVDPAVPDFGRQRILFREVLHLLLRAFTFRMYLDFSCALAFRTYLGEKLLAIVAVTEQIALGHAPPPAGALHSRTIHIKLRNYLCGEDMERSGTLKSSP